MGVRAESGLRPGIPAPARPVATVENGCDPGGVFERFTEQARQVVVNAQIAARDLGHRHIGTEHQLLGLLADPDTLAFGVLTSLGITGELARERVIGIVGAEQRVEGQMPFTPRAKKVMELSLREALSLSHGMITPEHLLLALARDPKGVAMQVLAGLGVSESGIREAVLPLLPGPDLAGVPPPEARRRLDPVVGFNLMPDHVLRRLLMAAGARALRDGRTWFSLGDFLSELTNDEDAVKMLGALDVDVQAIREALQRRDAPDDPAD